MEIKPLIAEGVILVHGEERYFMELNGHQKLYHCEPMSNKDIEDLFGVNRARL